jgi:alpha-ketoglutarate-dependent taurine dioxygenase
MTAFETEKLWEDDRALRIAPSSRSEPLALFCWAQRDALIALLKTHGALLLSGFSQAKQNVVEEVVNCFCSRALDYVYGSTPRKRIAGKSFTTTEYPAAQSIMLHTEMSYSRKWPRFLAFQCITPPPTGGETPIADMRVVSRRIGPPLIDEFGRRGVSYVRNYGLGVDLSWQDAFQTTDRAVVKRIAREQDIRLDWISDTRLRSTQGCQGTIPDPFTGEKIWFNQAHLFHVSSLPPETRAGLERIFAPEDLPRNATFGDGQPIPDTSMDAVRNAFWSEKKLFKWSAGDLLLIDNLQYAHGRMPFEGGRLVAVAMGHDIEERHVSARRKSSVFARFFSGS